MEEEGMEERKEKEEGEERGEGRGGEDRGQESIGILSPHTIHQCVMSRQVIPKRGSRAARLGRGLVGSTYVYISLWMR